MLFVLPGVKTVFLKTVVLYVIINDPGGPWNQSVLKKTNQKPPSPKKTPKNETTIPSPPKTPNQPEKQHTFSAPCPSNQTQKFFMWNHRLQLQNTASDTEVELLMSLITMPLRGG